MSYVDLQPTMHDLHLFRRYHQLQLHTHLVLQKLNRLSNANLTTVEPRLSEPRSSETLIIRMKYSAKWNDIHIANTYTHMRPRAFCVAD